MDQLGEEYDIVVNIQGDEPLMEPSVINDVVAALQASPEVGFRCGCHVPACCLHVPASRLLNPGLECCSGRLETHVANLPLCVPQLSQQTVHHIWHAAAVQPRMATRLIHSSTPPCLHCTLLALFLLPQSAGPSAPSLKPWVSYTTCLQHSVHTSGAR